MKSIKLRGDKILWGILGFLALFSFLPVFSASSNLAYVIGKETPWYYLFKHSFITFLGFMIMFLVHKIPFHYFKGLSILLLPITILLLIYTSFQGNIISGANANRWIQVPFIGMSFQPSTLAFVVIMVYLSQYLSKKRETADTFKTAFIKIWIPVGVIVLLILPSNFSTALLIFMMSLIICFLGGHPIKYLFIVVGIGISSILLFILLAKTFPDLIPNRVDTWGNRIENFINKSEDSLYKNYQIERSKKAIASGGVFGVGVGKSAMKNFLPQSSSDFIYAIIVEEFGTIGGFAVILAYIILLFRIIIITYKTTSSFGKLVVIGVGIPVIIQAFLNIGVTLEVFPITGQPLPLISSGGTAVLMTCIAMGIILSVSASAKSAEEEEKINESPLSILSETI